MKARVSSAVIMMAITVLCMALGRVTRILYFAACACICAYELYKNLKDKDVLCAFFVFIAYVLGDSVIVIAGLDITWSVAWLAVSVFFAMLSGITNRRIDGKGAFSTVSVLLYPLFSFSLISRIASSEIWLQSLLLAAASTWLCDSFALFGGMLFGKHKVAPSVSPNKTIEGCICGALSSLLAGLAVYYILKASMYIPLHTCLVTAFIASSLGQIGDLAESLIKRMLNIKDTGNLIPGHGGMLDRADSLLFSIPSAYFCLIAADHIWHFL